MSRKNYAYSVLAALSITALGVGCDDGTGTGGAGGTSSNSSTGASKSTSSTSGNSSSNSSGQSTSNAGSTSSSSADASSASSSSSGGGAMLNGCDPATATDLTNQANVTITFPGFAYSPPCIKVTAGTTVTFSGAFNFHPLRGGAAVGGVGTPDPNSPIKATDAGTSAAFTFPAAGSFGYYCNVHVSGGMMGAIFVQ